MHLKFTRSLLPGVAVLCLAESAWAQAASKEPAPASPVVDDATRLAWLEAELSEAQSASQRWFTGWTWGYAWLSAGQASLAVASPDYNQRVAAGVGASVSALGFLAMLATPHTIVGARDALERIDPSTPLGLYQRRLRAEGLLKASADEERFFHSWITHVVDLAANVGAAAVLIAAYNQKVFGVATLAAGTVIAELQIWSRPFLATRAWSRYEAEFHPTSGGGMGWSEFQLSLSLTPMGITARGTF
jgi:hypothetical protein